MLLLILERGEGEERERNIDVRGKHQLAAAHRCPDREFNAQPFGVWDDVPTN